ncbi:MAG: autotransporter outer membrane beta-barrel domain-containing protein, partial [Moraxellaceae bacterium]|nr:autotransporter outer membrane beta-barrel domain-containing protein [Moraxellaceae bacterium]
DKPRIKADGDSKYYGVGIMGKHTFNNDAYLQGGVRFGQSETNYNSSDLNNGNGADKVSFDSKRNYMGANVGVGGRVQVNDKVSLSPSASLLYSKYDKTSETIEGSTFNFDIIQSLRSQFGAELGYQVNDKNNLYSSLTWEREYKGEAKGDVVGLDMPSPSIKGDTGLVEIGAKMKPNDKVEIKIGAKKAFGDRRGASADVAIKYEF